MTVGGWGSSSFGLATVRVLPGPRAPDTVGAAGSLCHTGSVRTVVIIGASTPLGQAALALVASRRADFLVDGLTDDGAEPRQLAELCLEFTPLRLGITDGTSTELIVPAGSPDAGVLKEGAAVIVGTITPGAPAQPARPATTGPRMPF